MRVQAVASLAQSYIDKERNVVTDPASGTVPLDQNERLVEELAAERQAHSSSVSARKEVEELLRSEQAEVATWQSRLLLEQSAAEKSVSDAVDAAKAASAVEAELVASREAAARAARVAQGQMQDMQARLAASQQATDGADEAAAAMLEECMHLRGELREAAESREATVRELERAATAAHSVETELGNLSAAHALLKTEHSEAKQARAQSCDDGEELRNELAAATRRQAAQSSELEAWAAHIAHLEAVAKGRDEDEELVTAKRFSDDNVPLDVHEQLTAELRQAIQARTAAETEAARQRAEIDSQVQRLEDLRVQLEEGNAARVALQEDLDKVREELAHAQTTKSRSLAEPEPEPEPVEAVRSHSQSEHADDCVLAARSSGSVVRGRSPSETERETERDRERDTERETSATALSETVAAQQALAAEVAASSRRRSSQRVAAAEAQLELVSAFVELEPQPEQETEQEPEPEPEQEPEPEPEPEPQLEPEPKPEVKTEPEMDVGLELALDSGLVTASARTPSGRSRALSAPVSYPAPSLPRARASSAGLGVEISSVLDERSNSDGVVSGIVNVQFGKMTFNTDQANLHIN